MPLGGHKIRPGIKLLPQKISKVKNHKEEYLSCVHMYDTVERSWICNQRALVSVLALLLSLSEMSGKSFKTSKFQLPHV